MRHLISKCLNTIYMYEQCQEIKCILEPPNFCSRQYFKIFVADLRSRIDFYATHLLAHDSLEMSSLSFTKNQKTSQIVVQKNVVPMGVDRGAAFAVPIISAVALKFADAIRCRTNKCYLSKQKK